MTRPETIENRWDLLYRDYPEVYEAFAATPYSPDVYELLAGVIDLRGKSIADVGAGTGKSSLALARYAGQVTGIEREAAMLQLARENAQSSGLGRVSFCAGDAMAIPLGDKTVDLVTGITLALYPPEQYKAYIREGLRVAKEAVVYLGIAPGWYGGDLYAANAELQGVDEAVDRVFQEAGFAYQDVFTDQEYGTLEHIVATYGFIFGRKAIDTLRREQKTCIRWKFRVFWRG
jgi:SAM-dependent methyltransferase